MKFGNWFTSARTPPRWIKWHWHLPPRRTCLRLAFMKRPSKQNSRGQSDVADVYSRNKRSDIMSRIRSSGTKPERRLQAAMRIVAGRRKLLFNVRELPGCPDVVIPSLDVAIFADGCFYHGCPQHGHNPKSNESYWIPKLIRNRRRDAAITRRLRRIGFRVWRVWEHSLKAGAETMTFKRLERLCQRRIQEIQSS